MAPLWNHHLPSANLQEWHKAGRWDFYFHYFYFTFVSSITSGCYVSKEIIKNFNFRKKTFNFTFRPKPSRAEDLKY